MPIDYKSVDSLDGDIGAVVWRLALPLRWIFLVDIQLLLDCLKAV